MTPDQKAVIQAWVDWSETPEERRATLTHELVHLQLYRLRQFHGDLTGQLGKQAEAVADKAAERLEELAVERLAQVIARQLPIPVLPA